MLREVFQAQDRNRAVDLMHSATDQIRGRTRIATGARREFDVKEDIALEAAGKGEIKRAVGLILEQACPGVRHNPDNLDRRLSRAAALRIGRVLVRKLYLLTQRIAARPKLLCQYFIDN